MGETEKLQRAIELTISAGYQLDKEAFDFLSLIASTEDPSELVSEALRRIEDLKDKPLFIGKTFLKSLLVTSVDAAEKEPRPLEELPSPPFEVQTPEGKKELRPYAMEVEADLKITEDPTGEIATSGSVEDYLEYFQDRFKRLEKLLKQRVDVRSASSIMGAIKAPPGTKLKIIGMITEKREANQKLILTVEDLTANAVVLVPQNAPEELLRKARLLLLDQVVCLSVAKTRGTLLIAEDIILPDVPQRTPNRASVPVYAVLTSDLHVGSKKFHRDSFNRFILWLNGRYGDHKLKEIASHVKYVLVAGDVVDGIGIYPNQVKELAIRNLHGQYRLAASYMEQIPDYIEVIVIPGNHDAPRKALPQPALANEFLEMLQESRKVHSLGNPSLVSLHGVEVLLYHGRSLDDLLYAVPEMDHKHPEKAMKLLLQSRHLAPVYGAKTPLSPEAKDFLVIQRVPDIFHAGHVHVLGHTNYRGVLIVNSGGWQEQTDYMRRLNLSPTPGIVPVVNLQTLEVMPISFA